MDHTPPMVLPVSPLSPRAMTDMADEMPACQSCRKRKLKCSRQVPSCSQCLRLSCACVYDQKKQKPGLRSGMVEHLNKRIEALEKAMVEERRRSRQFQARDDAQGCAYHAALLIANKILDDGPQYCPDAPKGSRPSFHESLSRSILGKRKRHSDAGSSLIAVSPGIDVHASLPAPDALDAIIDYYFTDLHPWIPLIHEGRFRQRLADPEEQPKLVVLLHAIIVVTLRHVELPSGAATDVVEQARLSRNFVMLNAMDSLSVENLQALALLAFDHTGSGHVPSAWSIVGSLTKSVDYLQLAIEPDEQPRQSLLDPPKLLPDADGPVEAEERRRVFWNVILLDRFCSATSGWNSSLNSYNVRRRLPSNGGLWRLGEHAVTPYLGILDKSTAKVGNLMSYVSEPSKSPPESEGSQPSTPNAPKAVDTSNVGAFAFRIEAVESLNQVISFFLQQEVDFKNREEVSRWLARFKELDLRLVQWKLFFPQRWSNSKVSKEQPRHIMDPNLTLAHLTHNASTILLHQHIATPPPDVQKHVRLPSSCSAETCQLAAGEIASITERYLSCAHHIVPSQFAFCAFIAARTLLARWRFDDAVELSPDFSRLIAYLNEMSRRWHGRVRSTDEPAPHASHSSDIAARYAQELQNLQAACHADPNFHIELLNYPYTTSTLAMSNKPPVTTPRTAPTPSASAGAAPHTGITPANHEPSNMDDGDEDDDDNDNDGDMTYYPAAGPAPRSVPPSLQTDMTGMPPPPPPPPTGALVPLPPGVSMPPPPPPGGLSYHAMGADGDALAAMSQVFWDQQFLEMDRVFTLDGTDFHFE